MDEFKEGDVVKLKSGGFEMTISTIEKEERTGRVKIYCKYFHGGDVKGEFFYAPMLQKVD